MSRSVQRRLEIQRAEKVMPRGYVPLLIQRPRVHILTPSPISTTVRGDCCPMP